MFWEEVSGIAVVVVTITQQILGVILSEELCSGFSAEKQKTKTKQWCCHHRVSGSQWYGELPRAKSERDLGPGGRTLTRKSYSFAHLDRLVNYMRAHHWEAENRKRVHMLSCNLIGWVRAARGEAWPFVPQLQLPAITFRVTLHNAHWTLCEMHTRRGV